MRLYQMYHSRSGSGRAWRTAALIAGGFVYCGMVPAVRRRIKDITHGIARTFDGLRYGPDCCREARASWRCRARPRDVSPVHGLASVAAAASWAKSKHQILSVLNLHHLLNLQREPRARTGPHSG